MAKIPVFVVHGFLESGKTQFAMETLSDEYFSDGERNLVIACEEGIEEYEDEVLQKSNTTLVMLEDKSEFNEMFLAECQKKYKPTQVIVEYNCMWGLDYLREMYMPKGWFVAQVITTVDATTFDVYLKNMKSIFMEMAKDSDLIIFNSSTEDTPAATMEDQIPEEVKEARRDEIMELQQEISLEKGESRVGQVLTVMIEGKVSGESAYIGRTYGDAPKVDGYIFVQTGELLMTGDFARVRVTGALEYDLIGELEDEYTE